jgi:hypothetical protein
MDGGHVPIDQFGAVVGPPRGSSITTYAGRLGSVPSP